MVIIDKILDGVTAVSNFGTKVAEVVKKTFKGTVQKQQDKIDEQTKQETDSDIKLIESDHERYRNDPSVKPERLPIDEK